MRRDRCRTCPGPRAPERSPRSGPAVRDFAVGDRVAWTQVPGSYAEQVAVPAALAVPVPEAWN